MSLKEKLRLPLQRKGLVLSVLALGILSLGGSYFFNKSDETARASSAQPPGNGRGGERTGGRPQSVKASEIRVEDFAVTVSALGTVTASNTTTVKPRVDGQLLRIHFKEGQSVRTGDLLAEIDPRPFQIQLDQATGQLARDEALLAAARVDLARYQGLLAKDSIAKQQVDTQEAAVRQYQGIVETDKAQRENARLQLSFTRVTAPAAGRLGLRQVDVGNILRASDTAGIVVITRTQPIHAIFSIPAESIANVANRVNQGETLAVEAWDRDGRSRLSTGKLLSLDNQIDVATGTVKLKAEFANQDDALFPNQFVNIRLKVETRKNALLVSSAAVQKSPDGNFVYLIDPQSQTVKPRQVRLGPSNGEFHAVEAGLAAGDKVVSDGTDRLRPDTRVDVLSIDGKAVSERTDTGTQRRENNARPGVDRSNPAGAAPRIDGGEKRRPQQG